MACIQDNKRSCTGFPYGNRILLVHFGSFKVLPGMKIPLLYHGPDRTGHRRFRIRLFAWIRDVLRRPRLRQRSGRLEFSDPDAGAHRHFSFAVYPVHPRLLSRPVQALRPDGAATPVIGLGLFGAMTLSSVASDKSYQKEESTT